MPMRTNAIPDLGSWHGEAPLHHYFVCDVFTATPLEGNQLGVFTDGRALTADEMQRLARELNFAETVFLLPPARDGDVHVRIFTPTAELPFAGHPVLGTAFVVGEALGGDSVALETGAGIIAIRLEREDNRIVFGWMAQPIPTPEKYERERELLAALGLSQSRLPVECYRNGPPHVFVALESEEAVAAVAPDMSVLSELAVAVSCFAGAGRSWKTRMFFPAAGVPEDPATGSAAGPLALHLARHGSIAFGVEIEVAQGVEIGRPSRLYARVEGSDDAVTAVEVGGVAVIVAEGHYRISAG
jgi:trans-2,3-dihydro-3-hydroxyanthranilate isomerase